jgi:PKD repeat protein
MHHSGGKNMKRWLILVAAALALVAGACTPSGGGGGPTNAAPVAVIGAVPTSGDAPLTVAFSSALSTDDHGISSYTWDFGDGSPLVSGATSTHEYGAWGTYRVTLKVSDPYGLSAAHTTTATIAPPGQLKKP